MIKNFTYLLLAILMMPIMAFSQESEEKDNPSKRAEWQRSLIKDPQTGIIPLQELENGRNQVEQFYKAAKKSKTSAAIPNINWKERGPNDVGGRTRAVMWDPQNGNFTPKRKKVWAGGVSGGLWYNNNITDANSSWNKVGDFWDNIAISSLAYDPSNKQILYAATGERGGADAVGNTGQSSNGGGGIWKSIDGGTNWNRLASTIPDYVATSLTDGYRWREIYKVIVLSNGNVLALTLAGILRSTNGGAEWTQLTGTGTTKVSDLYRRVSDMELGADGILYVSEEGVAAVPTATPAIPYVAPRILKSTDNTLANFVECPLPAPVGGVYGTGRVEIALATGTQGANQVIYAVSAAVNTPDYRFFLKSVNGGTNWTNMTPSTIKDRSINAAKQEVFVDVPIFEKQGFWGLILGTHNTKPNALYFGGVSFDVSTDGGNNWNNFVKNSEWAPISAVMHADHHAFEANPDNNDEAIFGNDGGVYYSNNWSAPSTTLTDLNIQKRNTNYNVTQYFAVDLHPTAGNGLVVGGTQDNGSHAISSAYNTLGAGISISGGDGALTFIDQLDPNIVITSYTNITPNLHKNGAVGLAPKMTPHFSDKGKFINPAEYDSPAHTYYANFTYDAKPAITTATIDTLAIRYKITTSTVAGHNGYKHDSTYLTYSLGANQIPLRVSFLKLGKITDATSSRVLYIGTSDGDVYKTSPIATDGNQTVTFTKIMDKATYGEGNVSSIDFGTDENTIIVVRSNYNIKSVFYTTNANLGTGTTWASKDETAHGLPNIPIRYALINPADTKQVLLATDLGVWSTTDITATGTNGPDWKETNEALAKVRCDMLKYRASDKTVIVGTHGRGIFSTQLNVGCTPPTGVMVSVDNGVFDPVNGVFSVRSGSSIRLTSSSTGGTSQVWAGPNRFTSTDQNPTIAVVTSALLGIFTVTITSSGTCTATAAVRLVIDRPVAPTATSPQHFCNSGTIADLAATGIPGGAIRWYNSPTSFSILPTSTVLTNTTYYVAQAFDFSLSDRTPVVVNVQNPPTITRLNSNAPIILGQAGINFFIESTEPTRFYQWTGPNGFTSAVRNPSVNPVVLANQGIYTVVIGSTPLTNTCTATGTINVVINPAPVPTATIVYVNVANTNTTQNGNSWATAFNKLENGLISAADLSNNAQVWVAKGTYKPTTTTDRTKSFVIPSGIKVYGGFVGTETMLNQGNVEANPTILSGEIGSPSTVNDNSYHVVTFRGANNATVLDGFTIMAGNASFNSTRPPSSSNSTGQQPLSIFDGGGIGLDNGSSPTIINCRIISNDAVQGGGLYATNNSNPTVKNSVFMNNQATFGGGIYNLNSSPTYSNILIAGNRATGGGMYNNGSNPMITNVTIAGNGGFNGAIFNSNSAPVVKNSILWGNISPFNDTQSITSYSIVEGGYIGIGNLSIDPQFVNLVPNGLSPTLSGDYKLTNTSPAVDAGDNGMIGMIDTDLINNSRRFNNGIVDIGAYEFQGSRMGGTVISIVSGNWETGTTWNIGRKPLAGDTVIIDNNHIITVNNDGVMKNIEIRPNATLLYKTSGIKLQSGF